MNNEIRSERADLFDPNMYIVMTFDVIGRIDCQSFIDAAKRAFTAFEATMSRVVLTDTGNAYYDKLPFSNCTAEVTHLDFDALILEYERKQLAIEQGEMMKVFVKRGDDRLSVLVMAHHLAGDGKSVVYYIERMMKECIGESGEFQPLRLLNEQTLPKGSKIPRFYHLLAGYFNRQWQKSGKVFDWSDRKRLHDAYWQQRSSVILKRQFSPECVERIKERAKAAGVSMNSYILTAFLKANRRYASVGLAVDARLDGNRSMSNQATGITAKYTYNDKLTFEQNARELHRRIYTKLRQPPRRYFILHFIPLFIPSLIDSLTMVACGLYDSKISKKAAAMMGYAPLKKSALSVTNLTRLDIADEYGSLKIANLCFIPPLVSYAYETIGIATTSSGMTITLHSMNDRYTDEEGQRFHAAMEFLET